MFKTAKKKKKKRQSKKLSYSLSDEGIKILYIRDQPLGSNILHSNLRVVSLSL